MPPYVCNFLGDYPSVIYFTAGMLGYTPCRGRFRNSGRVLDSPSLIIHFPNDVYSCALGGGGGGGVL